MDKPTIRQRVWDTLETEGIARFPFPPHGRIPNFAGAAAAADRLAATDAWAAAETVKANPDAPQLPVRRAALRAGKTVYMAVPRLRDERCFYELDPDRLDDIEAAPAVSNVADHARQVGPEAVGGVDLVVSGSVTVSEDGAWTARMRLPTTSNPAKRLRFQPTGAKRSGAERFFQNREKKVPIFRRGHPLLPVRSQFERGDCRVASSR